MKIFYLFFLAFFGILESQIIEIQNFEEIVSHVSSDAIILLDIDDTLLIPKQMLGSDEWFCSQLKKNHEGGMPAEEIVDRTVAQWELIRHITEMDIVEPGTKEIVDLLQKSGSPVMGLTTQGFTLSRKTVQHLHDQEIFLEKAAPSPSDVYFTQKRKGSSFEEGVLYRHGILFTSGTDKGNAFFTLCEGLGYIPKKIIFINDKATHLREIELAAEQRGIPFVGLRYGYSDAKKALFQAEVAEHQFRHSSYHELMSDEEVHNFLGGF